MDVLERHYGKQSFTLYALFMPVPGSNARHREAFVTLSVLTLSFSAVFQVLKFVTEGFTLKLVVELVPTITAVLGCLTYILYLTFAPQGQLERILEIMENDLKEERAAEEKAIQMQYAMSSRLITNVFTIILIVTSCGIPLVGFIPYFLGVLMSVNHTREIELLFRGEIFLDQREYFYHIYFVESCTAVIIGILVIVSENISVIIGQHACGMGAVLGFQLKNITKIQGHKTPDDIDYEFFVTKRLKACINNHQKLLRFAVIAAEFYDIPLTVILATSFCALSTSLVQVTDPESINMVIVIFTFVQFCQFFLVSCMGQKGIDASVKVVEYSYNAEWDVCPPKVRRLLQLVMLRSLKPCLVVARGMYVLSVENFMAVIQTVGSFFMVFRQAQ